MFDVHDEARYDSSGYRPLENPFRSPRGRTNVSSILRCSTDNTRSPSPRRRKRRHASSYSLTIIVGCLVLALVALNVYLFLFMVPEIPLRITSFQQSFAAHPKESNMNGESGNSLIEDAFNYTSNLTIGTTIAYAMTWRNDEINKVKLFTQHRRSQRRLRTQPPLLNSDNFMDETEHIKLNYLPYLPKEEKLESQDKVSLSLLDLCGTHAQNTSILHPQYYSHQYALKNTSKVLITGILSPLGYHLALKLATECGIQVILGVDPIYPNTFLHRIQSQKIIASLTKAVPKLQMPIVVPFVGLDRRTPPQDQRKKIFLQTTDEINYSLFKVTHIIHLASSDPYLYRDFTDDHFKERYQSDHAYATEDRSLGHLFSLRQSLTSMEQLLMGLATPTTDKVEEGIQMTFVSASTSMIYKNNSIHMLDMEDLKFFEMSKVMDEMMARTYSKLKQVSSVALRIPTVYGPMGRQGSIMYELAEAAAKNHRSPQSSTSTNNNNQHHHHQENHTCLLDRLGYQGNAEKDVHDLLFVDDAVDSILTAMQYHNGPVASTLEISSGRTVAMKDVVAFIEQQMDINNSSDVDGIPIPQIDIPLRNVTDFLLHTSQIPLETGLNRLLSWHLDKNVPYGSASDLSDLVQPNTPIAVGIENGNDFLTRVKGGEASLCAANDSYCLRGKTIYPCMSECASLKQCKASPYDAIKAVSWSASFQCRTVVYTAIFGKGIVGLNYSAPSREEGDKKEICGIAFVSQDSALVLEMTTKVTPEEFEQMNVIDRRSEETDSDRRRRLLIEMNGRLISKGWRIIWMDQVSDVNKIEHSTTWLAALSPRRLFHPSVKYALYLADPSILSPSVDDVLFLTSQMWRPALEARKLKQCIGGIIGTSKELLLESEPERKVGLLVGALRIAGPDDRISISPWKTEIAWIDAIKKMALEVSGDEDFSKSEALKSQWESYDRLKAFVNSPQFRSAHEQSYKYTVYHWARTRWMIHDLKFESARKLRCDWYDEHILWGNKYEQLSFAHVMARREVERRILRKEPNDLSRRATRLEEDPDIDMFTDKNSWHLISNHRAIHSTDPLHGDVNNQNPSDLIEMKDNSGLEYDNNSDDEDGIYVRIMGESWAKFFRQQWRVINK